MKRSGQVELHSRSYAEPLTPQGQHVPLKKIFLYSERIQASGFGATLDVYRPMGCFLRRFLGV